MLIKVKDPLKVKDHQVVSEPFGELCLRRLLFYTQNSLFNFALMAISSSSSSSDNEIQSFLKACSKAYDELHSQYDKLTVDFRKSKIDVLSYQAALESVEARLVVYKQNESIFEDNIIMLKNKVETKDNYLITLKQKLNQAEKERDDLKLKEFHATKPDLVFHTVPIAVETAHSAFTIKHSSCEPTQDLSHTNRPSVPIIEEWVFDSEDDYETTAPQIAHHSVQSTKQVTPPRDYVQPVEVPILAATPKPTIKTSSSVLTQSKPVSITSVRPIYAVVLKIMVTRPRHAHTIVTKSKSTIRRHKTRSHFSKTSNSSSRITAAQAPVVSTAKGKKGKWNNIDAAQPKLMLLVYMVTTAEVNREVTTDN
nr:hypothetical protein [Tanacetum cinerariifolium]